MPPTPTRKKAFTHSFDFQVQTLTVKRRSSTALKTMLGKHGIKRKQQ